MIVLIDSVSYQSDPGLMSVVGIGIGGEYPTGSVAVSPSFSQG